MGVVNGAGVGLVRRVLSVLAILLLPAIASAADWPTWRGDARRSGAAPHELPRELFLQWVRRYPALEPAWPDQPRLQFDAAYEPIITGRMLFFASPANDCVTALDAETGDEAWRFYADGPVRFAPAWWDGKLYFACDDGCLYCLDAARGTLRWKVRGGPSERLVLGNSRVISAWPARGAPVVHDGTVYFGAGIWPFEGVFLYALDAETGKAVWTNDSSGSAYILQPHHSPAFAGVAPQGYLAVSGDRLLVPCGRSAPACFDLATGEFLYYHLAANQKRGGFAVAANREYFANGGYLYELAEGEPVVPIARDAVVTDDTVYSWDRGELAAYDVRVPAPQPAEDDAAPHRTRGKVRKLWRLRTRGRLHLLAGSRLFTGAKSLVQAIDVPARGAKPQVSWEARIAGTPATMLAASDKLFVVTFEGHIYCFAGTPTSTGMPDVADDVLVPADATWRRLDDGSEPGAGWRTAAFDDRAWAVGRPAPADDEDGAAAAVARRKRTSTAYFRHTFRVPADAAYRALTLEVRADDGAVAYLNGTEVWRRRVPDAFGYWTLVADHALENSAETVELDPAALKPGTNVLAIEVVAAGYSPTAPSFELELAAGKTPATLSDADPRPLSTRDAREDEWAEQASQILQVTGATDGYCLVLGLRTGRLAEELARRSRLHVIALDDDADRVAAVRKRLDALGLLGRRVAVRPPPGGRLLSVPLPHYLASLIVSEDPQTARLGAGSGFAEQVFCSLRPQGGVACLPLSQDEHDALAEWVRAAKLGKAELRRTGGLTLLTRAGAPPGAADWTHQNADAGNTLVSKDALVRPPLGILWFGGSTHERILPRHGHGPSHQVVAGRLFIEGPDSLRALDIYTGRVLWETTLPGLGEAYDNTEHQPGANAIGSNYVSAPDGVYVAYGTTCLRLDPATGKRLAELTLPHLDGDGLPPWGFITLWDDVLVAGTSPAAFDADTEFTAGEFARTDEEEIGEILHWLEGLRDSAPPARREKDDAADFLARALNALLNGPALPASLPKAPTSKARALERAIAAHLQARSELGDGTPLEKGSGPLSAADRELKRLNRLLLEEHCPLLPSKRVLVGKPSVYTGTSSRWLVAMNRYSGKVLWTRQARDGFLHNAIALGRDKLFCIDRPPEGIVRSWARRGRTPRPKFLLLALDVRTGSVLWSTTDNVAGTWLAYSEDHDVLLQAGRASSDMLPEPSKRMVAYEGDTGRVLWDEPHRHGGPCLLHGTTIIAQRIAFDLLSGEPRTRTHPLTGEEIPWSFARNYGCDTAIASTHLITFRSAAAGYYDLARDGGTGNFGGFRSGCSANLIPAGGVLCAPDYTRTCTCSYQNQCSVALIHNPEVETWTFQHLKRSDEPIRRVGVNFGAPGDRLDDTGTLWLDYPSVGGPSPHVPLRTDPVAPDWFLHHSSWVEGKGMDWVAASGAKGLRAVTFALGGRITKWRREHPTLLSRWLAREKRPTSPPRTYTVRLHFVEPDAARPGERVFDVSLQDRCVIEALDVAAEAGGPRRPLVREFKGVEVTDELRLALCPSPAASLAEPILCGIELVGED